MFRKENFYQDLACLIYAMVEEGKRPMTTTEFKRRDRDFDPEIQEPNKKGKGPNEH